MTVSTVSANPFALIVRPEAVIKAMQGSKSLRGLVHQQFRPLDREVPQPQPAQAGGLQGLRREHGAPINFIPTFYERNLVLPLRVLRYRFSAAC